MRLYYYITVHIACQVFFRIFIKNFFRLVPYTIIQKIILIAIRYNYINISFTYNIHYHKFLYV